MKDIIEEVQKTISEISNKLQQEKNLSKEDLIALLSASLLEEEFSIEE